MEALLAWGLGLMALGLILVIVDVLLPTGGVMLVTGVVVAVAGVVCLFRHDTTMGVSGLLAMLVLFPAIAIFGLKVWPSTPVGRAIIGAPTEEEVAKQRLKEDEERKARQAMVGVEGLVLTDLRPVGIVEINGERHEVLSEIAFVRAGTRVRVTVVEPNQIKVRPVA